MTKPFNLSRALEPLILLGTLNILQSTTRRIKLWGKSYKEIQESTRIYKSTIWITPFTGEKEKWRMWSEKFTEGAEIKGYHVLLTGATKIIVDDADKTKKKILLHLS